MYDGKMFNVDLWTIAKNNVISDAPVFTGKYLRDTLNKGGEGDARR